MILRFERGVALSIALSNKEVLHNEFRTIICVGRFTKLAKNECCSAKQFRDGHETVSRARRVVQCDE